MSRNTRRTRIAILVGAGLLVVLVAGGVSVSRWSPSGASGPMEPTPEQTAPIEAGPPPAPSPPGADPG